MGFMALGKVTVPTPGTLVRLSANRIPCQSIMLQPLGGNTGTIYVGGSGLTRATLADVALVLVKPAAATPIGSYSLSVPMAPAALDANTVFLDADTANDGVLVTLLTQ